MGYFEAKTDTALIENFHNLVAIFEQYSNDIAQSPNSYKPVAGFEYPDNIREALDFLQTATPFFIHSCIAECSDYQVDFDLDNMILRAKETKGTLDDAYFELLKMSNGTNFSIGFSYKEWYLQTWDIGGGSVLGNKLIYQFLKKSKEFDTKMNTVDPVLEMLREDALRAALLGTYMLAPVKILEEIKLIVNENLVSAENIAALNKLASELKSNSKTCSVCVYTKLEYNCETEECSYGREE